MKYNGVITKKIEHIDECLIKIEQLLPLKITDLEKNFFLKSGIERVLQVSIEAVIDIAERIISLEGYAPVTTSFKALEKLEDIKLIKNAEKYKNMIQFRNFIVHRYESIDNEILIDICNNKLNDLKDFLKEIMNYE